MRYIWLFFKIIILLFGSVLSLVGISGMYFAYISKNFSGWSSEDVTLQGVIGFLIIASFAGLLVFFTVRNLKKRPNKLKENNSD